MGRLMDAPSTVDSAQREHHRDGWRVYLDRLATRATGGDPGPDPNANP
jgi:hypothetical protein